MVIESRKGDAGGRKLDLLIHRPGIDIVPFDSDQAGIARSAWRVYGEGSHSASLNIGDCCFCNACLLQNFVQMLSRGAVWLLKS